MACAVMHRPEILFLDEATSGADLAARRSFWRQIVSLSEAGTTVGGTTHFMEEAALADRVLVVSDGVIRLTGAPAQVFDRVEEMKEMHLDVPPMTALADELRKNGMPLCKGILTVDDLVQEVEKVLCPSKSAI